MTAKSNEKTDTLETKLEHLARQLSEARQQQEATSEILRVISTSTADLQPVFDTILERAVRLCEAAYGYILRYDGKILTLAAHHNVDLEGFRALQAVWPMPANVRESRGPRHS